MKYYLIVGEASGDLHASFLMQALHRQDPKAEFRFYGGDLMGAVSGAVSARTSLPDGHRQTGLVRHYKDLAFMGFVQVALHARTILMALKQCEQDILAFAPDHLILVDYPGFNLRVAKYVKQHTHIPIHYYISPKIWAWKERRIHSIKRYIDQMLCILPFETEFYADHEYAPVQYVGNPTAHEVQLFKEHYTETRDEFTERCGLSDKPIIALLPGSRKAEIKDNLPRMLAAAAQFPDYQPVIGAVSARTFLPDGIDKIVRADTALFGETYPLLLHSRAALVTSGTATLETALLGCPQVVCYYMPCAPLVRLLRRWVLKVPYISLVNLIAGRAVVRELVAGDTQPHRIAAALSPLLTDEGARERMQKGYKEVEGLLGRHVPPEEAAALIVGARHTGSVPTAHNS